MTYQITAEHVWIGAIPDRPAALAEKLQALSAAGVNLELIVTRREMPGRALLLISPLRTLDEIRAAESVGLSKENSLRTIRIEGPNVPGLGARVAGALAEAGIDLSSYTATALGALHVTNLVFDHDEDVERAQRVLERALSS